MAVIYFIGTVHIDIDGAKRLEKILRFINPDAITIETNDDKVELAMGRLYQSISTNSIPSELEDCLREAEKIGFNRETYRALLLSDGFGIDFEYFVPKLNWELKGVDIHLVDTRPTGSLGADLVKGVPHLDVEDGSEYVLSAYNRVLMVPPNEAREIIHKLYLHDDLMIGINDANKFFLDILKRRLSKKEFQEFQSMEVLDTLKRNYTNNLVGSDEGVESKIRELSPHYARMAHIGGNAHTFQTYPVGENNLYDRMADANPIRFKLTDADKLPV